MSKIVTLGEIMLRLSTPLHKRFIQSEQFNATYAGAEANVAVSLANYGYDAYFVSKVPNNLIGKSAINQLRQYGVNTDYVSNGGDRLGVYYLETGASMRPSKVIYDRAHSSFSKATIDDFDFDEIFKDCTWFHFSGITPALSDSVAKLTERALQKAKAMDITVSVDLNYRKALWTREKAQKTMIPLMQYVDVCIGNEEDIKDVLGYTPKDTDITQAKIDIDGYKDVFKTICEAFDFRYVVSTLRESYSASDNGWRALLYDGESFYTSKKYDIRIVDRVGGGDSFTAGLIHGLLTKDTQDALEFAVAASALKHTIHGDFNLVSEEEVNALVNGDASGRVKR